MRNSSADHPTSIMSPLNQGMTCLPVDDSVAGHKCGLGGYPVYVVNARNAKHIQAAVNFARNMNIRLVVKNTGHDFHGKASGFGSLSIRTHHLKDIVIIKKYQSKRYTGPAIKAGSGVQGFELYAAAHAVGLMAVGGEGMVSQGHRL
jgi:FAD/FMN-containing dehydrogenase